MSKMDFSDTNYPSGEYDVYGRISARKKRRAAARRKNGTHGGVQGERNQAPAGTQAPPAQLEACTASMNSTARRPSAMVG